MFTYLNFIILFFSKIFKFFFEKQSYRDMENHHHSQIPECFLLPQRCSNSLAVFPCSLWATALHPSGFVSSGYFIIQWYNTLVTTASGFQGSSVRVHRQISFFFLCNITLWGVVGQLRNLRADFPHSQHPYRYFWHQPQVQGFLQPASILQERL